MLNPHELALFNYAEALLPVVSQEFETMLANRSATDDYSWMPAVCRYNDDNNYNLTVVDHGSMGATPRRQELRSLPLAQFPDAATASVHQEFYGEQAVISADYMYYADGRLMLTTGLQRHIQMFAESALKRERLEVLNLYANAFTIANGYQTWEAKALCDVNHHNVHDPAGFTFTNYDTQALDVGALQTVDASGRYFVGVDGLGKYLTYDTLMIGPKNVTVAQQLLRSINDPATAASNAVNTLAGRYRLVVCPDFQEAIITGSSNWWFLLDSSQHTMNLTYGKRPRIRLVTAENGRDLAYQMEFDLTAYWYGPYGHYGSIGNT